MYVAAAVDGCASDCEAAASEESGCGAAAGAVGVYVRCIVGGFAACEPVTNGGFAAVGACGGVRDGGGFAVSGGAAGEFPGCVGV